VAEQVIKLMARKGIHVVGSRILVLGLTFKENCPDLRNTKVIDAVNALKDYRADVDVYDPWIDGEEAAREYGIAPLASPPLTNTYDAVVLAVAHREFLEMGAEGIRQYGKPQSVVYDVKSILPSGAADGRL